MHIYLGTPQIYRRFQKHMEETRRFFGNYVYYRKRKHGHSTAWKMARNTL